MARSKNSTALFEVIHAAKKPPKSSPTVSVPTPKWWHKSAPIQAKPATEALETAGKQGSWLAAAAKRGVQPTPAALAPAAPANQPVYESSDDSASSDYVANTDPTVVAEPIRETPKPRFAERFAERFARKAAAAKEAATESHPGPVEPIARIEIPSAETSYEPEFASTLENTEVPISAQTSAIAEVRKTRHSRGKKDDAVALDRGAKEVRFRLSYGGMISLVVIFLLVVALAVLIGSRYLPQAGESADDGKKPSDPMMLALTKSDSTSVTPPAPIPTPLPDPVRPDVLKVNRHPAKPVTPAVSNPKPTEVTHPEIPVSTIREVGSTYIVMQNWDDKQIAQKACDYLNKNGISCSLVRGLKEWTPHDWYSVVGLFPFTGNDPTMDEYEKKVTALGIKFSNKAYNRFEPKPYVWQANSDSRSVAPGSGDGEIDVDR